MFCLLQKYVYSSTNKYLTLAFSPSFQLSAATTTSLHELASLLRVSDYASAGALYAAVVSGPSFAEAAAFMPAIKVLMQQGQQLGVVF